MYELRFFISDLEAFENELKFRQASLIGSFCFSDEYYEPLNAEAKWKSGEISLRVRSTDEAKALLYAEYALQHKKSVALVYNTLGEKLKLATSPNHIESFLKNMGCRKKATITRRSGRVYRVPINGSFFECTLEDIVGYGWTSEVELSEAGLEMIPTMLSFFEKTRCRPLMTTFFADFVS